VRAPIHRRRQPPSRVIPAQRHPTTVDAGRFQTGDPRVGRVHGEGSLCRGRVLVCRLVFGPDLEGVGIFAQRGVGNRRSASCEVAWLISLPGQPTPEGCRRLWGAQAAHGQGTQASNEDGLDPRL
jgi:hypothetical protein